MARDCGFDNINMDMIVGLPGEDKEDVRNTLEQIMKLSPDNLVWELSKELLKERVPYRFL